MRAVLVVNPQATSTTLGGRDVLAHALASEMSLEVVETTHRGHAAEVGADAARAGIDMVIAHGGDGTVNEIVNGMLAQVPGRLLDAPMLGVVPGGSANVFARACGYPRDPVEATHVLLEALARYRTRRIGLGMADGRYFTFAAGMGWDADVVSGVDRRRGKKASPLLYTRIATTSYFFPSSRSFIPMAGRPKMTIHIPGEEPVDVRTVFVSNTDPWTYLGPLPIRINPGCRLEGGLGVFAPHSLDPVRVLSYLQRALMPGGYRGGRGVVQHDDVEKLTVLSDSPVNFQVDGDLVGKRSEVEFVSIPDALTVVV